MKTNTFSLYLIYTHAFFLSVGTDTLSFKIYGIPVLDTLLIIYFFLNFRSISLSINDIKDILIVVSLFIFFNLFSTIINAYLFDIIQVNQLTSFLQYISYFFILLVYYDFLKNNTKHFFTLSITFFAGIISLVVVDIYVADQITKYNFFSSYGSYIFAAKYVQDEYCIANLLCHKLVNVNNLSSYVGITFGFLFGIIFFNNKYTYQLKHKYIYLFILFLFIFISVGLGQKTAYFSWIFNSIFLILFCLLYFRNVNKIYIYILFIIILLGTALFSDYIYQFLETIYNRTQRIQSFTSRFDFASDALNLISSPFSVIFGSGKNSYYYFTGINDPHNFTVQVLLESGVIGFILYFYIVYYFINKAFQYTNFLGISMLTSFLLVSNANGLAFQSHTAWIIFTFIIYLGAQRKILLK